MVIKMSDRYSEMVEPLVEWFQKNARELRWRSNPIPYYVWLSEIMLQQTRVEAVKSYFNRFVSELPTIEALANAPEEKILKLWEGLGYYNRVKNMQKAAIIVMEQYGGELPQDYKKLLQLPGIGSYTAGAISSIAYHIAKPAVDGNVLRVAMRLKGCYDDITKPSVKKELEKEIETIMPKENPGIFNQAFMELGATICIPNGKPLCNQCPLAFFCTAKQKDIVMELPVKKPKKKRRIEEKTVFIFCSQNKAAISKREEKGLLSGLWQFPNIDGTLKAEQVKYYIEQLGYKIEQLEPLGEAKHIFSHIEWHMTGYKITIGEQTIDSMIYLPLKEEGVYEVCSEIGQLKQIFDLCIWADKKEIEQVYTLPTAFEVYRKKI